MGLFSHHKKVGFQKLTKAERAEISRKGGLARAKKMRAEKRKKGVK